MNSQDVFNQIAKDLGILSYPNEDNNAYNNRIAYSAVGLWARTIATVSDSPSDEAGNIHKGSYHKKLWGVITRFSSLLEDATFFYPKEDSDPAGIIRDTLLCAGDLVEVGFNSRVSTSVRENMPVHIGVNDALIGLSPNTHFVGAGLAQLSKTESSSSNTNLTERFNLPIVSAEEVFRHYYNNAEWEKISNADGYEIFNPVRNGGLSNAWESWGAKLQNIGTVARLQLSYGVYDYRLFKACEGQLYISRLSEYAQSELVRDTQRILYGIKSLANKRHRVKVEKFSNYSVWHFWSKLPPQEEKLLSYIGWPLKDIDNRASEFVIKQELNPYVYYLSANLCMCIEETDYE